MHTYILAHRVREKLVTVVALERVSERRDQEWETGFLLYIL